MVAARDVEESELPRPVVLIKLCKLKSYNVIVNLGGKRNMLIYFTNLFCEDHQCVRLGLDIAKVLHKEGGPLFSTAVTQSNCK